MKFLVDLWLDGYDNDADLQKACLEFIKENLDFSASSVDAKPYDNTILSDMAAMLKRLEWDDGYCPICDNPVDDGHVVGCEYAALLRRCKT